jgi:hypothetical protein
MTKLNKRQIIIIIIAVMALLYGAYTLLSSGKEQKDIKKSDSVEKSNYISSITSELIKNPLNLTDAYIVSRAEADWGKNPFWEKGSYKEWANRDDAKTKKDDPAAKIIYSGYVDVGKKKMAVINGLEYSVGDKLEIAGYVLKKITALKVVISNKNTGSELEITIQE